MRAALARVTRRRLDYLESCYAALGQGRARARRGALLAYSASALAGGKEHAASKPGLASLLKTLWGEQYQDERDARFINDRVHANIQKDGTFSVVPRIYGGVTTPDQLRRIADVAERHQARMVKITGGQRIDLLGIPRLHGFKFELATGALLGNDCAALRTFPVELTTAGEMLLRIAEEP